MKKVFNLLMLGAILAIGFSCGDDASDESAEKKAGEWDKVAKEAGLSDVNVQAAVGIGTDMQSCYNCESAPGAMDSEMTDACDIYMDAYRAYCSENFGTDDYNDESEAGKKVQGFRDIMFGVRNKKCK